MEKTITIDDKKVKFKATANTPRLYRQMFHRELFDDMQTLVQDWSKARDNNGTMSGNVLMMFENIAFTMAKDADPEGTPETADEWLDGFDMFSVWQILPQVTELWGLNNHSINESKKKAGKRKGS